MQNGKEYLITVDAAPTIIPADSSLATIYDWSQGDSFQVLIKFRAKSTVFHVVATVDNKYNSSNFQKSRLRYKNNVGDMETREISKVTALDPLAGLAISTTWRPIRWPNSCLLANLRERAKVTAITNPAAHTILATDLSGQPWLDGYVIGKGINAETGNLASQAIDAFTITPAAITCSNMTYSSIETQSDVEQQIQASADGSYNMDGVTISASTSFLSEIRQSELSMTVLATYEVWFDDYDTIDTPVQLAPTAKSLVDAGNFDQFRQAYGDYYIAGRKRWSFFRAVFTLRTQTESDLTELQAKLGAAAPEVFTATGAAAFKSAVNSSNASLNLVLDMQGYSGTPPNQTWTIDSLSTALNWFQANLNPIPVQAEMIHYSQVDNRIPITLPIDPQVFSDVRQIYIGAFMTNTAWNSLPTVWQPQYEQQVLGLMTSVSACADSLVTDPLARSSLMTKVVSLLSTMTNLYQRFQFIQSIHAMQGKEPGVKAVQAGTNTYGSIDYTNGADDPEFVIQTCTDQYKQKYHVGYRNHDFNLSVGTGLILQWQVVANWKDGTDGHWWKNEQANSGSYVLLNSSANIHIKSDYDKGFDYTVNVWYVDASLVPPLSSLTLMQGRHALRMMEDTGGCAGQRGLRSVNSLVAIGPRSLA